MHTPTPPPSWGDASSAGDLGAALEAPPGATEPAHTSVTPSRLPRIQLSRVLLVVALVLAGAGGAIARTESGYLRVQPGPAPNLASGLRGSVVDPGVRERSYLITTVRVEEVRWGRYWFERLRGAGFEYVPADPRGGAPDPAVSALQMRESKRVALALARAQAEGRGAPAASGVIVTRVVAGSAAASAGVQPGDRIVSYAAAGREVPAGSTATFVAGVQALPAGAQITLQLATGPTRSAQLRGEPGSSGRLGVEVVTEVADAALTPELEVDTSGIGGPSGGLVISLLYLDALTAGDLTGGRVVAGTGTISLEGEVGEISGIADKVQGAQAAGAQVFFAPASEAALAREAALGTLEVVGVERLEDAVAWLCGHGGSSPSCPAAG